MTRGVPTFSDRSLSPVDRFLDLWFLMNCKTRSLLKHQMSSYILRSYDVSRLSVFRLVVFDDSQDTIVITALGEYLHFPTAHYHRFLDLWFLMTRRTRSLLQHQMSTYILRPHTIICLSLFRLVVFADSQDTLVITALDEYLHSPTAHYHQFIGIQTCGF